MAEIHNYTMNFSFGRPSEKHLCLTSLRELACTEVLSEVNGVTVYLRSEAI